MRFTLPALLFATLTPLALAQPKKDAPNPYAKAEKQLDAYLLDQVKQIEAACLTDLTTRDAWEKKRPELRRQFFDMMGLWPLPPKTPLKATVTGTLEHEGVTIEKLHFQYKTRRIEL